MKILLYTDTPQVGGAELQMLLLAKFLNKEKFEPILAASNYPQLDEWCRGFEKENIKVKRLRVWHKHDFRHHFQLKKLIQNEKIDILHAHIWNPGAGRYAYTAAKATKTPLITTEHDPFQLKGMKEKIKSKLLKNTSKIITVSRNNLILLKKIHPEFREKMEVIHNGIDISWWQSQLLRFSESDKTEAKEEIFLAKSDTLIILTIAELHERKGINHLINAIPEVIGKFPNVKFVLVGDGPHRDKFIKQAEDLNLHNNIVFLGRRKDIPKLLKSAEIFLLPSIREAFGFVNLEAMICGTPVIASKTGGIPEIIEDNKNGLLISPRSPFDISNSIVRLIENPELREKFKIEGKKTVIEKFSAEKMATQYEKTYLSIFP